MTAITTASDESTIDFRVVGPIALQTPMALNQNAAKAMIL
jgi:hypothetical protein